MSSCVPRVGAYRVYGYWRCVACVLLLAQPLPHVRRARGRDEVGASGWKDPGLPDFLL